jgi:hypothetical protein
MQAELNALRQDPEGGLDISLQEMVKQRWGVSMESFFEDLQVNPNISTIHNLINLPDAGYRWLVPEVIRDAIKLGLRKNPIYSNLVAQEITVAQPKVTLPYLNMSDAVAKEVGVGETIPLGNVSYGDKSVAIKKYGRGVKIPMELRQFVSINLVSTWLTDFGVKMGMGLDSMAINCLINGDQTNGSESAPTVGVDTTGTITYKDILRVWVRMSRIGRTAGLMIGGEDAAIETLNLPEFKTPLFNGTTYSRLNMKTPIPVGADYYVHGGVAANKTLVVDAGASMIKLNAMPLLIENEKEISNQTEEFYATVMTGFATLFRDGRVIIDKSVAFSGNGFPSYMDPTAQETEMMGGKK